MKLILAEVVSNKRVAKDKTLTVLIKSRLWNPKYKRYYFKTSKLFVHSQISVPTGKTVKIIRTRLRSPTKAHQLIDVVE